MTFANSMNRIFGDWIDPMAGIAILAFVAALSIYAFGGVCRGAPIEYAQLPGDSK